jgi:hypothetical protein
VVAQPTKPKPYELAPTFERAVAVLCCSRPRFYGRIGHALDPDCITDEAAKLSVRAVHAINADLGRGPGSPLVVFQRLHNWRAAGRATLEQINAVSDMVDDVEDAGMPDEDGIVNELAPVLKRRLRDKAVRAAIAAHGKDDDLHGVVALEQKAERLGQVDTSIGTIVGEASFEDIRELRALQRLRTGIVELDTALAGGHQRAGLACVMGGSGDGKSMMLSHQAGVSTVDGHVVGAITLELPRAIWNARAVANMTGIPINALLTDDAEIERRAMEELEAHSTGLLVVQQMPAQGTSVEDVAAWVDNVEQHVGRKMTVLIVDYVDKMWVPPRKGRDVSTYDAGKVNMEGLRAFVEVREMWGWTASQSQGRKKQSKLLDLADTAESMNKPRIADLWITLNVSEEQDEVSFFIAKHRTARSRFTVGPLPTEFEVGRVAPILLEAA